MDSRINVCGLPLSNKETHLAGVVAEGPQCNATRVVKVAGSTDTLPPTKSGPCSAKVYWSGSTVLTAKTDGGWSAGGSKGSPGFTVGLEGCGSEDG